ncbi:MAG: HEAT repeat domain-containing protein [Planctomycetota bacterium]|nr:HEAT repeat domain-containing protein [Planctomycetota bacterium]
MKISPLTKTPAGRRLLQVVFLAVVAVALYGLAQVTWGPFAESGRPLADLVGEIAAGQPAALDETRRAAARDWPAAEPTLAAMLHHDEPPVRAAACSILAAYLDAKWLAALLPRASDTDWRVRVAAFQALSAAGRLQGEPLRDTPLDEREAILLAWLDAHDVAAPVPLGPDLCELYAGDRRVEFGRPLAARCLACHAGADPARQSDAVASPAPFAAGDPCANCHGAAYQEWSESAHAQSLSHLALATVNPSTRQPERMGFGEVRGIGCRECHRPVGEPAGPIPQDRTGLVRCPFTFRSDLAARDSCGRCHASTAAEWRAWLKGPQPRIATWPPGEIQTDRRGDTRTCVDCHMPERPGAGEKTERGHAWAARRDVARLREGVAVRMAAGPRDAAAPGVRLILINLAGHAYPTGSRRRAIRIVAGPPGAEGSVAAGLSPDRPGRPAAGGWPGAAGSPALASSLAPGEQREFVIPAAAGAQAMTVRLQYCRDVTDPAAAVTDIFAAEEDLRRWVGPQAPAESVPQ